MLFTLVKKKCFILLWCFLLVVNVNMRNNLSTPEENNFEGGQCSILNLTQSVFCNNCTETGMNVKHISRANDAFSKIICALATVMNLSDPALTVGSQQNYQEVKVLKYYKNRLVDAIKCQPRDLKVKRQYTANGPLLLELIIAVVLLSLFGLVSVWYLLSWLWNRLTAIPSAYTTSEFDMLIQ